MNKQEFLKKLSEKRESTVTEASKWLNAVFESIGQSIQEVDELKFIGFGTFKTSVKNATKVKTPKGDMVDVPERRVVKFVVGSELKEKALTKIKSKSTTVDKKAAKSKKK